MLLHFLLTTQLLTVLHEGLNALLDLTHEGRYKEDHHKLRVHSVQAIRDGHLWLGTQSEQRNGTCHYPVLIVLLLHKYSSNMNIVEKYYQ